MCHKYKLHGLKQCGFVCYLKQLYERLVHLGHGKSPREIDFKGCRQQNTSKLPSVLCVRIYLTQEVNFPHDVIYVEIM